MTRYWLTLFAFAAIAPLITQAQAQDQTYPSKAIRFIVPFAPGGTNDIVARIVGAKLSEIWNQPVVVDNRGGAGGVIGTELGAKSSPDGYTLLMANVNLATNPSMVKKLPYDTLKDLSPVSLLATSPTVLVVTPSFPAKTTGELITYAKNNPGKLNYSTSGAGSTTHIAMELLISMTKIKMTPVHYKGGGPAMIDLIAGRVSPGFTTILSVIPHLKANRLHALAVSTKKRSPVLPDIPTVAESGLPGYEFTGWWGMVVPAKTPQGIVSKINTTLKGILADSSTRNSLIQQGATPEYTTTTEFSAYIAAEISKWAKVIKQAGIQAN